MRAGVMLGQAGLIHACAANGIHDLQHVCYWALKSHPFTTGVSELLLSVHALQAAPSHAAQEEDDLAARLGALR